MELIHCNDVSLIRQVLKLKCLYRLTLISIYKNIKACRYLENRVSLVAMDTKFWRIEGDYQGLPLRSEVEFSIDLAALSNLEDPILHTLWTGALSTI